MTGRRAIFPLLAVAVLCVFSSQAQAAEAPLTILNPGLLTISAEKGNDLVKAKFTVLNTGTEEAPLKDVSFQASSDEHVKVDSWEPEAIPAGKAEKVTVFLSGAENLSEEATGQLVVTGGKLPISQAVAVDPAAPDKSWPAIIIVGSLAVAILVAAFVIGSLGTEVGKLLNAAPNPKWSFSSWATTLTALAAAFGTVLGKATFPKFPDNISSAELVNLNIFFAVLVLIGPFLFETLRSYDGNRDLTKVERTGSNATMLLASSFTLWAVLGQMASFALLGWELLGGNGLAKVAAFATLVLGLLACWYFLTTMSEQVRRDWKAEETTPGVKPAAAWPLL